ncbi:hypothetical protein J2S18_001052 [Eubacterium multiforme]|uniref:Uncharacterized protein n=1 Tax=Eubacterium multiforme TaxID=83339 RepID=A0ABT9US30_9FIRM|nr:hypothetical protein [Eubacterium multiforme]
MNTQEKGTNSRNNDDNVTRGEITKLKVLD